MPYNYDLCFKTPQNRWIYEPTKECRKKGKEYTALILERWAPPDYYFHFRSGGHIAAIETHKEHLFFAKVDLKSFFPSISKSKVIRSLKNSGLPFKLADTIAGWSTIKCKETKASILPYGFIQSQMLAALCLDLSCIGSFIRKTLSATIAISVYVDDIILSSNDPSALQSAYDGLVTAINETTFSLNEEKSHPPQKKTTAFNIDLSPAHTEITEERFNSFIKDITPENLHRSEAIIAYVSDVNDFQASLLEKKLKNETNTQQITI